MKVAPILLAFCAILVSAFPVPVDSNARRMVEGLPLMKPRSLYCESPPHSRHFLFISVSSELWSGQTTRVLSGLPAVGNRDFHFVSDVLSVGRIIPCDGNLLQIYSGSYFNPFPYPQHIHFATPRGYGFSARLFHCFKFLLGSSHILANHRHHFH